MKRNEIVHKMHNEIEKIDLAIEQMQKICNQSSESLSAQRAEYAINLLNLAKKNIQETLTDFDDEFDDNYVDTFTI